jgi:alpha-L-fucosidase
MIAKKTSVLVLAIILVVAIVGLTFFFKGRQESSGPTAAPSATPRNFVLIGPSDDAAAIVRKAASVVPSPAQAAWQDREFTAFAHFGMNTFTDREWGQGTEDPKLFNPADFDARQWIKAVKDGGMKMLILTAKHHDGFCLWPSTLTGHSVKRSPWKDGKGDVVAEVSVACREEGLAFGVYLSPWDRHEPSYGDSPRYNEHFRGQLRELLTNYGPIAEVWFDGANGEGPNGKKQVYDWPSYYEVIRELQPHAVIFGMAPDIRWVGTESGYGRETEWSVVPADVPDPAASSPLYPLDGTFTPKDLTSDDLGSRAKIVSAKALAWYPAETDVSIRPGWFYHAKEDGQVKSPDTLVDIYFSSVGRNGVLLLNVPPDKRGRISEFDAAALRGMRRILDGTFKTDLAVGAGVRASSEDAAHAAAAAVDGDDKTYWSPVDRGSPGPSWIEVNLGGMKSFDCVLLQENIAVGQRVESFRLDAESGGAWKEFTKGTTVGYKRLLRFPAVAASKVRLTIDQARTVPTIAHFGLYKMAGSASVPEARRIP